MKIVFFGNPEFAATSLEHLNSFNNITIELVITNPDKEMGRGLIQKMSPVKETARKLSCEILECNNLLDNNLYNSLKSINADLFIVVAYKFIPERIYRLPEKGAINLHASLLPKYRGASPIQYALLNGDDKTGLTTFYLNNSIDKGNIISQFNSLALVKIDVAVLENFFSSKDVPISIPIEYKKVFAIAPPTAITLHFSIKL